jgi:hypothetical protein
LKLILRLALSLTLCLLASSIASAQRANPKTFHTEGTFSNITMGSGGDYGGIQIYLTDSDGQFYATVTIAEGVLMAPVMVKAQVDVAKRKIEFALPNEGSERKFTGTVSATGLTLWENGAKSFLKRKCY